MRFSSKDTTSNLFNRYVWLVDTIYRAGRITFEAINNKWIRSQLNDSGDDLPLKTFHNHKNAVQTMFDINIECDRRNGCVYYIENFDDMKRGGVRSWLISSLSISNLISESHKLKHRILFEHIPSGQRFLTSIIEAMRDGIAVEITYKSYRVGHGVTFPIEPYCVKVFKQRWYVVGYSVNDDTVRIYGLDRILELQTTNSKYVIPEDFPPEKYFENCYGVVTSDDCDVEEIDIKVFGKQVLYVSDLPLHHSQREIETTEDYSVFRYTLKPTYDFRQEILSNGSNYEVLSPQYFRDEIVSVLRSTISRYE